MPAGGTNGNAEQEHYSFVKSIIADQLGLEPDEIGPDAHLMDDLGGDSLDAVEIIMTLEERYDIEIPEDAAPELHSARKIADYVMKNAK